MVKVLIERGADLNIANSNKNTALMLAAQNGDLRRVNNCWIENNVVFIFVGDVVIVKFLIDGDADVDAVGKNDATALIYAAEKGN